MQTFSSLKVKLGRLKISDKHLNHIWSGQRSGRIRLFKLIDILITYCYIDEGEYNNIISELCRYHLDYYQSSQQTDLETLATRLDYSRERVRQINKAFKDEFNKKFSFLKDLEFIDAPNLVFDKEFIELPQTMIDRVNEENNTDFTRKFITRIYSLFTPDFQYVGDDDNPLWKSAYLITSKIKTDLVPILNSYRVRLKPYPMREVDQLWYYGDIECLSSDESIISGLKYIVEKELGLGLCTAEGLLLPRTKKSKLDEKIFHVLNKLGPQRKGYKLNTIISELEKMENRPFKISSVRGTINKNPIFSAYGKTSTYILTEWLDKDELDIISGDYWRVCQRLLEREDYPLDQLSLMDKLSYHRTNPDKKSIMNMLKDTSKNIFLSKESFLGLLYRDDHSNFMSQLKNISGPSFSQSLWQGFRTNDDVYKYFGDRGVIPAQTAYLIRYMKEVYNVELGEISTSSELFSLKDATEEKLISELHGLDGLGDRFTRTRIRREHLLLKKLLFHNKNVMPCAICDREFPVSLLAVAHIKRRSLASPSERVNKSIVMAACYFGCDLLYEKGYIYVEDDGRIMVMNKPYQSSELKAYTDRLKDKACKVYNIDNKTFFAAHRYFHRRKVEKAVKLQRSNNIK